MVSENLKDNFKVILFVGPTASQKSFYAHFVADELLLSHIHCEIVNLDAFQIYTELTAGTAKPSCEEIEKYKYHGINLISLNENLDANSFASRIYDICKSIYSRGSIPICVGGSGLYLRAFLHGLDSFPARNDDIRNRIRNIAQEKGWAWCHNWLTEVDSVRAKELHPNDKVRIERALEIYLITGKAMSLLRTKTKTIGEQETSFLSFLVHMEPESSILKNWIMNRIPVLFQRGWLEEVNNLYKKYGNELYLMHSMQAIGYKNVLTYIESHFMKNKEYFLDSQNIPTELIEQISTLTWQYAKRQRTWNHKEKKDFVIQNYSNEEKVQLISQIKNFIC